MIRAIAILILLFAASGCVSWKNRDIPDDARAKAVLKRDMAECRAYADDAAGVRVGDREGDQGRGEYKPPQNFKMEYEEGRRWDEVFTRCMGGRGWDKK